LSANGTIGETEGEEEEVSGEVTDAAETGELEEQRPVGVTMTSIDEVGHPSNTEILSLGSKEQLLLVPETYHPAKFGNNMYITLWGDSSISSQSSSTVDNDDDDVLFAKSTDNGANFEEVINLSNSPYAIDYDSRVVTSSNHEYVTWSEHTLDPLISDSIWFRASSDHGSTFGPPIRINTDAPLHAYYPTSEFGIVRPTDDHSAFMIYFNIRKVKTFYIQIILRQI
jgi:hypothetical protein